MPIYQGGSEIAESNGAYSGNDVENRAIPHGLGKAPVCVLIICTNPESIAAQTFMIISDNNAVIPNYTAQVTVTAMDSTNFYVGKAAAYNTAANASTRNYKWVAL